MDKKQLLDQLVEEYAGDFAQLEHDLHVAKSVHKSARQKKSNLPVIVELKNVQKQYKLGKHPVVALDNVSLTVHEREIVALMGPSGSGKSTVLNIISGLDSPDDGSVTVTGQDISKMGHNERAKFRSVHMGFVFQFFYLQPFLTLQTNVEVPAMFAGINRSERSARSNELIQSVGLADRAQHKPKELSGGQMQRAAIARALLNMPQLLLADEPTGNLDSTNAKEVVELFKKVRDDLGTTVVIVTHDPKVAELADRIIELKDGKVVE